MKDLHLAAPAAGDFAGAALDAASAWRFAPTRLGGVPFETPIQITFDFQAEVRPKNWGRDKYHFLPHQKGGKK